MFYSVLVFAAFACFLPNGSPLKCYRCSPRDNEPYTASCKSPKNLWNITDCGSQRGQRFDRCGVYRSNSTGKVAEGRGCSPVATCVKTWFTCQAAAKTPNSGIWCYVRCCKGDLCNKGELEPPKYELFEPSGKSLSCYTCSDFPRGTRLAGSPRTPDPRNCTSPVKQMCGGPSMHPNLIEDRCTTVKVKAFVPSAGNKVLDWTYRGCSSIFQCSFTEALWRYLLNQTRFEDRTGIRYLSGKSSCCHGNLCDSTTDGSSVKSAAITNVEHLSTGLAGFLFFVLITMIKALFD